MRQNGSLHVASLTTSLGQRKSPPWHWRTMCHMSPKRWPALQGGGPTDSSTSEEEDEEQEEEEREEADPEPLSTDAEF